MATVVTTICDYTSDKKENLSFDEGDEIIILKKDNNHRWKGRLKKNNEIGYFLNHYININRMCFCKKPLKQYQTELELWTCHCCNTIRKKETIYYKCGKSKQCLCLQIGNGNVYDVCAQCFNAENAVKDDDDASHRTTSNDFISRKIRASMKRMKKEITQCASQQELKEYIFTIYRGLYIGWIRKLNETAIIDSKSYKMMLDEFDAFYGALLSKYMTEITQLQKSVRANCDYKGKIENELSFNKNDKIIVLFEHDNGCLFGKLDRNGRKGMLDIDYIYIDYHINQICCCMKPLKKKLRNSSKCRCCCKEYPQKDVAFYNCRTGNECEYRQISGYDYNVCSQCFYTEDDDLENKENTDDFSLKKVKATIKIMKKEIKRIGDNEKQRIYMTLVYRFLYQLWMAKLKDGELVEENEYQAMVMTFNTFYNDILSELRQNIDDAELEISGNILFSYKNKDLTLNKVQSLKLNEVSLEWHLLTGENEYFEEQKGNEVIEFANECSNDIYNCVIRKRIEFIMNYYKTNFLHFFIYDETEDINDLQYIEIFENALKHYDDIHLLNDYFHIETFHKYDDALRNCDIGSNGDNYNNVCCALFWRQHREKTYESDINENNNANDTKTSVFTQYLQKLDRKQRNIMEISSKIHSFINHSQQHKEKEFKIRNLNFRASKHNKFMNEIEKEKEETKETEIGGIDDLLHKLKTKGLDEKKCKEINNGLKAEEYDTEAIIMDLSDDTDEYNHYKKSNIYNTVLNKHKYIAKIMKKHFGLKHNDDDYITKFMLGFCTFEYSNYYKDDLVYNKAKYKSLKDECMNNTIHSVGINTFNSVLSKAFTYANSFKGKSLKAADHAKENNIYGIPVHLPVSVSHIMVLMFYCNFDTLQRKYKKFGCRETNKIQYTSDIAFHSFKQQNAEIGHWYKLLNEAIFFYGSRVKQGQVFYTGINIPVAFASFTPMFKCPFSTTTQWDVANGFSEGIGVILKLEPLQSSLDIFFNVEWISNFKEESERLFFLAHGLHIVDIQYVGAFDTVFSANYMRAFELWSALFNGYYFILTLKKRRKTQETLYELIWNYKANNMMKKEENVEDIDIPFYIQQLFFILIHKLQEFETVFIIRSEYLLLNELLHRELLLFDSTNADNVLLNPFLNSLIYASKVKCLEEYIWILSDDELQRLKNGKRGKRIMCEEQYRYGLTKNDEVTFSIGIEVDSSSKYTGFTLQIDSLSSSSSVSGNFSIAVDELNWVKNRWPFNGLRKGQRQNIFFFADKLLKDLQSLTMRVSIHFKP